MLKEYHYDHLIRWPNGERAAIFLSFDFQGGEDVKPDKNGVLNYESLLNYDGTSTRMRPCGTCRV